MSVGDTRVNLADYSGRERGYQTEVPIPTLPYPQPISPLNPPAQTFCPGPILYASKYIGERDSQRKGSSGRPKRGIERKRARNAAWPPWRTAAMFRWPARRNAASSKENCGRIVRLPRNKLLERKDPRRENV